jgi:O-antigen ligase
VFASGIALALTGYSSGVRFQVFQENSNYIGILALLMLAGVAWQAFGTPRRNRWLWQGLVYIYLLASILIVAMTGSRGSALSLFVILLVFLAGKQTRGLGIVGICCVILGLVLAPIIFSTTIERFTVFDQENTILGGRETLWPAAWMMIKDHPWAGVGIGNSEVKLISYLQNFINTIGEESTSGHNPILTIWMETGIPGFVLYMGSLVTAVILFMRELIKRRFHRKNSYRTYFDIVGAIFLGYMVTWIKGGGIESDKTFFLMLALLLLPLSMNRIVNFNNHPAAQKRG